MAEENSGAGPPSRSTGWASPKLLRRGREARLHGTLHMGQLGKVGLAIIEGNVATQGLGELELTHLTN